MLDQKKGCESAQASLYVMEISGMLHTHTHSYTQPIHTDYEDWLSVRRGIFFFIYFQNAQKLFFYP